MTHTNPSERRSTVDQTGQVWAFGMSLVAGDGVTDPSRDVMTRLASMLGAKEMNFAKGNACLSWENDFSRQEYGVAGPLPAVYKRPIRPAAKLSANSAINAATIAVTPAPNGASTTGPLFQVGQPVHIGDGTNGELAWVKAVTATNIDLDLFEGVENRTGLVRAHSTNDPVYQVPTHYGAGNTLFVFAEVGNFAGRYGSGVWANSQRWFQEALRWCVSRMRAAEVFEPDHTALVFSGASTWGATVFSGQGSGSSAAQGLKPTAAIANPVVTFHVPDNFPGGTVAFNFANAGTNTGGGVWTFTVDGAAWTVNGPNTGTGNTMTTVASPSLPVAKTAFYCARLKGLAAGRHTIVATQTTLEANNYFDCFTIESPDPPIVCLLKAHRLLSWDGNPGADHSHIRTKLNAQANPAATSITVNQSDTASTISRQITNSPQVPKAGEIVAINPRTSLEEERTVTTVNAGGPPWVINFSGGGLANTHPVNTRVELGIKDYDLLQVVNPWLETVRNEFDDKVILHDPEPYIHPQTPGTQPLSGGPKSATYFHLDEAHWSDEGAALVAQRIYDQLAAEDHLNSRLSSRLSRPIAVPLARVEFFRVGPGSTTALAAQEWTNMPAALTELFGSTLLRAYADLSRYYESRLICHQTVIGAANAKLRVQYSIDNGATWKHLHRVSSSTDLQPTGTTWSEPTAATDFMWGEIALGTTLPANSAPKKSGWAPLYPEATMPQYTDLLLRVIGIGGDGVIDPALSSLSLELR